MRLGRVYPDIAIPLEGFEGRGLRYRIRGALRPGQLILDDKPLKRQRRKYIARDNTGREVVLQLKPRLVDPVPTLRVDGKQLQLVAPLKWYEYLWAGLPLLLTVVGGAIGGGLGGAAAYQNVRLFRTDQRASRKYLDAAAISVAAVIAYLVLASSLVSILGQWVPAAFFAPPKFAPTAWARRTVAGMAVDAPFDFDRSPELAAQVPQQARDLTERLEAYVNHGPRSSFLVSVARTDYKPGVLVSLDGAAAGAVRGVAASVGDTNPQYSSHVTTISGFEGRRASYQYAGPRGRVHVEWVLAHGGQRLWQLQIVYVSDTSAADAERILNSVSISNSEMSAGE
jgi:hypothetical protein